MTLSYLVSLEALQDLLCDSTIFRTSNGSSLGFDSLPTDLALLLEYVPPVNIFAKRKRGIGWLVKITNRDIKERPVRDGSPLWVIMGVSI